MAQFDVYRNPDIRQSDRVPYVLDIQNNLLADLSSRVVIPLESITPFNPPLSRLNPVLHVAGQALRMVIQEIAAAPVDMLTDPITNLESQRYEIVGALDMLVLGV